MKLDFGKPGGKVDVLRTGPILGAFVYLPHHEDEDVHKAHQIGEQKCVKRPVPR